MPKLEMEFEDYNDVSNHYDEFRQPVGTRFILESVNEHFQGKNLKDLSLLDCGCGTGNYLRKLSKHFGTCTGFEINEGMFKTACNKLLKKENVFLNNQSILEVETEKKYDVVLITQVLHHLDDEKTNFKNLEVFIANASRFLKTGGLLFINTCKPEDVQYSYWFYSLLPKHVVDKYASKYAPFDLITESANKYSLQLRQRYKVIDNMMKEVYYYNEFGILNEPWRKSDSIWSLLSDDELENIKDLVKGLINKDYMKKFIMDADKKRKKYSQSYFLVFEQLN